MATVRGMTPEAIRALLKKEIGDYQALSIAVNSARGTSQAAIAEVENIRKDLQNMDFDFDTSKLDQAMAKFETDMTELNQNLDKLKDEALVRENKLTALQTSLSQDRSAFNKEMRNMAQELADSKQGLQNDLQKASEELRKNLSTVSDELSNSIDVKTGQLHEDLNQNKREIISEVESNLTSVLDKTKADTDALRKDLAAYQEVNDNKTSKLLSDIEVAKAYADGFLRPGNLVWNPDGKDNARGIYPSNSTLSVKSAGTDGYNGFGVKITNVKKGAGYIHYGKEEQGTFALEKNAVFYVSAWVKSSVSLPSGAVGIGSWYASKATSSAIPAQTWVKIEGESRFNNAPNIVIGRFEVALSASIPEGATIIISDFNAIRKANSDLIVEGAVSADKLAANSVIAGKIATNAVTTNNIVAGAIGADKIAANAVTSDKIVANAVSADKIDANAVTADKIAANAVTAGKVAANAITTREMTIEPGNLFSDPRFLDPAGWGVGSNRRIEKTYGYENAYTIEAVSKQIGSYYQPAGYARDCALRLEPGASYRLTCRINFTGENPPDRLDMYVRYTKELPNKNTVLLLGGILRDADNTNIAGAFGVGELDFSLPAEAKDGLCTIGFFLQKEHKTGAVSITDVNILRAADASLIVKGGIQSDHIAANAITSDHISANSIDGDRIKSNTLDADKIKSNSLTSDHVTFKDGFIKNAMIGDGQITNAKIKDLNADKINAGTLNANRIRSKSITGAKLAANTITGDNIQANSIRVGELHVDSIIHSGMSLILAEATGPKGGLEPIWWKMPGVVKFSDPEVDGEPWYGSNGERIEVAPKAIKVKILQGIKYRLKFNICASSPGSVLFIEMRDQNGDRAVQSGAVHKGAASYKRYKGPSSYITQAHDYTNSTEGNYLVSNYHVPTTPTQVVALIEFRPNVTHVYLSRFYFNHSNGVPSSQVRISALTLEADIPNQSEIDERQAKELTFLRKVTNNIATMLARHEYYIGENFIVEHGFSGFRNYAGVGVKFPRSKDTIHFYLASGWDGKIEVHVTYTDGSTELFNIYSSDIRNYEFKENYSIEPPPSNIEDRNKFAYASVSTNKLKIPSYAYVTLRQSMSTNNMMEMLSRGYVPVDATLPIKRRYSVDSAPPWDDMGGSSRRPW